jgi:hypothetical protein
MFRFVHSADLRELADRADFEADLDRLLLLTLPLSDFKSDGCFFFFDFLVFGVNCFRIS